MRSEITPFIQQAFLGIFLFLLALTPLLAAEPSRTTQAPARAETRVDPRVAARSIGVEAAEQVLRSNPQAVALDVRTEAEYAAGHIPGALNVNSRSTDFKERLAALEKSRRYVIYSAGGGSRVTRTAEAFESLSFTNWINLDGGYKAWTNLARPVAK